MKKLILPVLTGFLLFVFSPVHAQVSVPANAGIAPNYVGWNAAQLFPLRIQHLGNQPITIGTNGSVRMGVANGPGGIAGGRIAFGNNLPAAFVPQDRLHSFVTQTGDNMFRFSNIGFAATQGFRLGMNAQNFALFDLIEPGIFRFDMADLGSSTAPRLTKFTIANINQTNPTNTFQPTYFNQTRVGIWSQAGPANGAGTLSMLHLGVPGGLNLITHRDWMNLGTYYNEGGDAMYVGLRQLGPNLSDAIIAWGDDGNDRLKILFNTQLNLFPGNPSSSVDGLEVARFYAPTGADGRVLFNYDPSLPGLDPLNTVHIVGPTTGGTAAVSGGNSGLRLHYVLSGTTPPVPNPGPGVLAVDNAGDVIYVQAPPPVAGPGNLCGSVPNPLLGDYVIPLNGNNYSFEGDAPLNQKVNFGYPCAFPILPGKVNASTAFPTNNIAGLPPSITSYAQNTAAIPLQPTSGFYGTAANNAFAGDAAGVWGYADASRNAFGVRGIGGSVTAGQSVGGSFSSQVVNNSLNIGMRASGDNANTNYGVLSLANGGITATGGYFFGGGASTYNIGVVAIGQNAPSPDSYTGFYPQANIGVYAAGDPNNTQTSGLIGGDWAAWFDGDVYINGLAYYPGFFIVSDGRFKKNVKTITKAVELVEKLNPTSYGFVDGDRYGLAFPEGEQYGFISQEVEAVLPSLVKEVHKPAMVDGEGNMTAEAVDYKSINYIGFIALLTSAIQEHQSTISTQQSEIDLLKEEMAELRSLVLAAAAKQELPSGQQVQLSDMRTVVLNQNVPNPFAERTTITYHIDTPFDRAEIIFVTVDGTLIKTVNIATTGPGILDVYAGDLSSGVYMYSLIVDGKVIETKKLVKQR